MIMNKEKIIRNTERFVRKLLIKEDTGHDWWHIERVRKNAKLIGKSEKVDKFVVDLTVLLHDVGDRKVIKKDEDDYSIAENFLKIQKVPREIIEKVMYIIKNMSFSQSLNNKKHSESTDFCVVQDSDRLDAIGAIAIARVFTYGGRNYRPIYDPTKKAGKINTTKNYRKLNSSSFHHFEEKLLLLKNLINTKSAKKIALGRHNYMKNYTKQFLSEWHGKK